MYSPKRFYSKQQCVCVTCSKEQRTVRQCVSQVSVCVCVSQVSVCVCHRCLPTCVFSRPSCCVAGPCPACICRWGRCGGTAGSEPSRGPGSAGSGGPWPTPGTRGHRTGLTPPGTACCSGSPPSPGDKDDHGRQGDKTNASLGEFCKRP